MRQKLMQVKQKMLLCQKEAQKSIHIQKRLTETVKNHLQNHFARKDIEDKRGLWLSFCLLTKFVIEKSLIL
jgi:hypothetical protein